MKKIIISFMLVVAMLLLASPQILFEVTASETGSCGNNLTWTFDNETETLTISGEGPMADYEKGEAPWYAYAGKVNTLIIEEGVTTIGSYSFYRCMLAGSITIPTTITHMNESCFEGIMDGVSGVPLYISDLSAWCKIKFDGIWANPIDSAKLYLNGELVTNLIIPADVRQLENTFYSYDHLVNVIVPEHVIDISYNTFASSMRLRAVVFRGDALPGISDRTFYGTGAVMYYPADNSTYTDAYISARNEKNVWTPYTAESNFCFIDQYDKPVLENGYILFHTVAIGEGLSYQWQHRADKNVSWTDVDSEYASTPLLSMLYEEDMTGQMQCVVTDTNGNRIVSDPVNVKFDLLYEYAPKRVEDTVRYLNEIYIEKYPKLGLRFRYGDNENRKILLTLAETITEGCTTDKEKADTIARWVTQNVTYVLDVTQRAFPIGTFYRREGVCFNYALLTETLMRLEGIPAVWGEVWNGNTLENTVADMNHDTAEVNEGKIDNHAICWVYVDGEWVIYDYALCNDNYQEIAEKYYVKAVDMIVPVYGSDELPPTGYKINYYYVDGKFITLREDNTVPDDYAGFIVNYHMPFMAIYQSGDEYYNQGYRYLDHAKDTNLVAGELFRDGFIQNISDYSEISLAYENGIHATHTTIAIGGEKYWTTGPNDTNRVLVPEGSFFILENRFCLFVGYHGKVIEPCALIEYQQDGGYTITWSSNDPDIAAVDQNGVITALAEGSVQINLSIVRDSDGGLLLTQGYFLEIVSEKPVFDFTDHTLSESDSDGEHVHIYAADVDMPTCEEDGLTTYICDCGNSYTRPISAYGHDYFAITNDDGTCTSHGCVVCGDCYTVEHEPTEPTVNPFTDVPEDSFYFEPVLWAVENGITTGATDTTFDPNGNCLRGHVVTFLWRAAGSPEPTTSNNPFTDVKETDFFYKAVLWAVEKGITNGTAADTFSPYQACNRAQVVTFLWRAAGKPQPASTENPFSDVVVTDFYGTAVLWAVENGITNGMGDGTFGVLKTCNRAQVVTFLYRAR